MISIIPHGTSGYQLKYGYDSSGRRLWKDVYTYSSGAWTLSYSRHYVWDGSLPNRWHLVLWPRGDGDLTAFMRKLTHTHAQRWKTAHDAVGHGHLYQGRFKSFPVQRDEHLLTVLRYVERNPLRAKLVQRVQDWPWSSFVVRRQPKHELHDLLAPWPVEMPADWARWVNTPQTPEEQKAMSAHIRRGRPFGDEAWTSQTVGKLGLHQSLRPIGRPAGWRKNKPDK